MHTHRRSRRGFTLIELIIVIVVLGILAGIAIAGYTAVVRRANITSVERSATSFNQELTTLAAQKATQSGNQTGLATDRSVRDGNTLLEALQAGDGPKGVTVFAIAGDNTTVLRVWDGDGMVSTTLAIGGGATDLNANQYYLQFVKNGASVCLRLSSNGTQATDETAGGTPTGQAVDPIKISDFANGTPNPETDFAGWIIMKRVASGSDKSGPNSKNACNGVKDSNPTNVLSNTVGATPQAW